MKRLALILALLFAASAALAQQGGGGAFAPGSGNAGYPPGATPQAITIVNTTTGATASTSASLVGASGQYTYMCGWNAFTNGGTAQDVTVQVGAFINATLSYLLSVPAFAATNATTIGDKYGPCLRASTLGGNLTVIVPAQGTGNTNVTVNVWGYTQ